ncbi:MAG: HD domain-containing phosphohydrolase [Gemmatimonadota bacterium]
MAEVTQQEPPLALLYYGDDAVLEGLWPALAQERIEVRGPESLTAAVADLPSVLLLDEHMVERMADPHDLLKKLPDHVVVVAANEDVETIVGSSRIMLMLPRSGDAEARLRVLRAGYQLAAAKLNAARADRELARSRNELYQLHRIGMALMTERDPDKLLVRILEQARRLTHSDAGSLYLVEPDDAGGKRLRFKLSQNDTLPDLPLVQFTLPISTGSLAGYAAHTGEPLVLADAYAIPPDEPYSFNRSFDERTGYRTKSMLVVPMMDHREDVVGVLQLLNRKNDSGARINSEEAAERYVLPYGGHELQLVQSLAGQAAVSIENSQLYAQIEHLFESFVKAAVTAIDQRDPTTAGHSIRVATLTVDIAAAVERGGEGPYRDVNFTRDQMKELRYAAMLHDFGKVGVREEVLVKSKKLPPFLWERVQSRFDLIIRSAEVEYHKKRAELLLAHGDSAQSLLLKLEEDFQQRADELRRFHEAVRGANEPTILPEAAAGILDDIAKHKFLNAQGEPVPFLDVDELHFLKIPKGTLNETERLEIESHVEQTYRFLTQIPWTEDLQNLPVIAYGHHEKLNGKGYPRGVAAPEIPIQTRMMTIADIFDALTASDRPYKRARSAEKALSILQMEAKDGLVDQHLVDLLIKAEVYKKVLEQDWREL